MLANLFTFTQFKREPLRRKFVINLALLLFLNLLVKPFYIFGIDFGVQNAVGEESYGFYFPLISFSIMLNIFLDLGIENYNKRNIAQNSHLLSKHVSNIIILKLLLGVVYFTISMIIALLIGYELAQLKLLMVLLLNQFILSFILYLRSNIAGLQFFKTDSIISVIDRLLMILICGVLLWGNVTDTPFQIEWFVYAQTAAYAITALIAFIIVYTNCEFIKLRFDRSFFIVFLKKSYPYALLILIMASFNRIDPIFLERMLPEGIGQQQAGIYAQGFRFLEAAIMFGYLFGVLLLPMFSKMIKQKEPVEQLVQFSFLILAIPAIVAAFSAIFYKKEIISLLDPNHYESSPLIFSILMSGFIFIATGTYIFGSLLTANGSVKQLNIMATIALTLSVILNLTLVPRYMAVGSAISSLVTQAFFAIAQLVLAIRVFKFRINYKLVSLLFLFTIGSGSLAFLSREFVSNWLIGISAFIGFSIILAFSIRLLNIRLLFELLKTKTENPEVEEN